MKINEIPEYKNQFVDYYSVCLEAECKDDETFYFYNVHLFFEDYLDKNALKHKWTIGEGFCISIEEIKEIEQYDIEDVDWTLRFEIEGDDPQTFSAELIGKDDDYIYFKIIK